MSKTSVREGEGDAEETGTRMRGYAKAMPRDRIADSDTASGILASPPCGLEQRESVRHDMIVQQIGPGQLPWRAL
ncbi:hypothetical protein ABU162_18510 [Paenibacillus thiaminolyticus]|uniref:hypothetical protein n=1 Tax=Paenibacillus thiaminolyticus TaxID=49283 RepID=UPI0035A65043